MKNIKKAQCVYLVDQSTYVSNSNFFSGINTSKTVAQDDEPDLGNTLSPLGSTSSLQELMETSSSTTAVVPDAAKTTWIERERQKKSVIAKPPTLVKSKSGKYSGRVLRTVKYTLGSTLVMVLKEMV